MLLIVDGRVVHDDSFEYSPVLELKRSNKMQLYADIYLLLNFSKCFARPSRPSSGVHKTVFAASGTEPYLVTFEEACSPDSMICT